MRTGTSAYLTVSVDHVLPALPVPLPPVRLALQAAHRRVPDDRRLFRKGRDHGGRLLVVVEARQGWTRRSAVLCLDMVDRNGVLEVHYSEEQCCYCCYF